MTKRMLVDATHPEETRVAIVEDRRLEDFDFESTFKKQLKGNIYLAKVIRIEPSLQAAFVEYGGNRHGFLPFSEIHPDYFRIPMADRPHDESEVDEEDTDNEDTESEAYAEEVRAYEAEAIDPEEDLPVDLVSEQSVPTEANVEAVTPVIAEQPVVSEPISPRPPQSDISSSAFDTAAAAQPESGTAPIVEPSPVNLASESDADLGLITDFGNAVVEPVFTPAPVETVGGHGSEEEIEERVRRPRPPRYKIQEVVKRRQIMLIQVVKEERGNKGAALTTYLSLAGRYCVLMPNTDRGGGVSRKITSHQDRRRMKEILDQLETPEGMAVILRTAGMEREPTEIQRDLEHLLRLWNNIREQTLVSTAPALIYEEANLIKRSIRDLYAADVEELLVAGKRGHELAHEFMRSIMPEAQDKVRLYEDPIPLFFRYNVEKQIDQLYNPVVQLRSGGYIVINPTEALVSIDVNSGRATRERHIEGTALKTNLEAADEIARQLRLRDLAGLVVIDFIDMEDGRNNAAVERRMKEAMKTDRARLQIGRLSAFGLMEISRQRLHPSLTEINFEKCPHCGGVGMVRSVDSSAISILRQIEEDAIRLPGGEMLLHVPTSIALYILNQKRAALHEIETRYSMHIYLHSDDSLIPPDCRLERVKAGSGDSSRSRGPAVDSDQIFADTAAALEGGGPPQDEDTVPSAPREEGERTSRRRGRFGRGRNRSRQQPSYVEQQTTSEADGNVVPTEPELPSDNIGNVVEPSEVNAENDFVPRTDDPRNDGRQGNRRRGRRGGRSRRGNPRDRRKDFSPDGAVSFGASEQTQTFTPPDIPISVHDLDTTPRDTRVRRAASNAPPSSDASAGPSKPAKFAPPPSPYEITNPETDKPKGGWWRRLTGQ